MSELSRLKERVDEMEKNVEEVEQKAARLAEWASMHQSFSELSKTRPPSTAMIVGEKVDALRKAWNHYCFDRSAAAREALGDAVFAICGVR